MVMALFAAVCSSVSCSLVATASGRRFMSPITLKRTLFFMKISSSSDVSTKPMRAATSSAGRFQFSVEKVYSVRYLTPSLVHSEVILRTVSTPAWCP